MNKSEFSKAIQDNTGASYAASERAFEGVLDLIAHHLKQGDVVKLNGIGTLTTFNRKERAWKNKHGEGITDA